MSTEAAEVTDFVGATRLPFVLDRVDGASAMLVGFPGYRTGRNAPPLWLRTPFGRVTAHRLLLGSDEDTYVGPARQCLGLATAAQLIQETADSLQVPLSRVACVGSSMAASLAALTGLATGVGLVILGAPPLLLGSLLSSWAEFERRPGSATPVASAARFLDLARAGDDDPAAWLDDLIFGLATSSQRAVRVRILANEEDFTYPGVRRFVEHVESISHVQVAVERTEIPKHDEIATAFHADFLPRVAAEELCPERGAPT